MPATGNFIRVQDLSERVLVSITAETPYGYIAEIWLGNVVIETLDRTLQPEIDLSKKRKYVVRIRSLFTGMVTYEVGTPHQQ